MQRTYDIAKSFSDMAVRSIMLLVHGVVAFSFFFHTSSEAVTFTIHNNCPYTIWPAALTGKDPQLSTTGFELPTGASNSISVPNAWSGRFWARTGCSSSTGRFTCVTGDCGSGSIECNGAGGAPPASLIELTLAEQLGGMDFYDVSLVDGFNLPVTLAPQDDSTGCKPSSCPGDVNRVCPAELAVKGPDSGVVGCKSACLAFNTPQYCCRGEYGSPETCPPTSYSKLFKSQCPDAYSYAYDDKSSTFTCTGRPNYLITFCP